MSTPLRILHICGAFPPDYGGGATETTRDIAVLQAEAGHQVAVLCCSSGPGAAYDIQEEELEGLAILRVFVPDSFHRDPEGFLMNWPDRRRHETRVRALMTQVVSRLQPQIVDYHVNRPLGEEALLALDELHIPVVASLHDFWMICPRVHFMRSPSNRPCGGPGPVRCLLCMYSHYDGSALRAVPKLVWRVPKLGFGIAWKTHRRRIALRTVRAGMARSGVLSDVHAPFIQGPCAPILQGISTTTTPSPDRGERDPGPLRFGFFGGTAPPKGLADVRLAVATLLKDGLRLELHVFGPGSAEPGPNVVIRGSFQAEGRGEAYSSVDVALMATKMVEPRGRIPEEASVWGVPSIVPRIGGLSEVVRDEVDGLLYRFRDIDDLVRQMRRVLQEPGLLKRLRGNLRRPVELRDSLGQIEAVYRQAMMD